MAPISKLAANTANPGPRHGQSELMDRTGGTGERPTPTPGEHRPHFVCVCLAALWFMYGCAPFPDLKPNSRVKLQICVDSTAAEVLLDTADHPRWAPQSSGYSVMALPRFRAVSACACVPTVLMDSTGTSGETLSVIGYLVTGDSITLSGLRVKLLAHIDY